MGVLLMKEKGKKFFIGFFIPFLYRFFCCFKKVQGKVLLLEIRYDGLSDNLRLIKKAYDDEGLMITKLFCLKTAQGGFAGYMLRCISMVRQMADAAFIYVDESSDVLAAVPVRKQTVVVQCWHACGAFKRFGHGLKSGISGEYYGPYDLACVSSADMVPFYEDAMNQKRGIVRPLGISRTDVFFDENFIKQARNRVNKRIPGIEDKRIVLYAPTFRGNVGNAKGADRPDIAAMKKALGNDWIILYKEHPSVADKMKIRPGQKSFCIDVSDMPIDILLCVSDVCITDYSSLIFEFSLFDRPIIFFVPDRNEYEDARGFYHTIEDMDAGDICLNTQELIQALLKRKGAVADQETKTRLAAFRKRFMSACDGKATLRIKEQAAKIYEMKNRKKRT